MIVDAFLFNDEFDMLDIRLAIMDSWVDRFVILEGDRTWSGVPKPWLLSDNLDRYHRYQHKLTVIPLTVPEDYVNWQCENHSRRSLNIELVNLDPNDTVIHGDLDEVPDVTQLDEIIAAMDHVQRPVSLRMEMYAWRFDQRLTRDWNGTVIARRHMFQDPQQLYKGHNVKRKDRSHCALYPRVAGWHWTWIGDDQRIRSKVRSCIESQHRDPDQVLTAFRDLDTAAAINHKCDSVTVTTGYPPAIQLVLEQYPQYWTNPHGQTNQRLVVS